ncbi:hypothetical protein B296_00012396, partial [Ensete ventricosum]
ELEGALEVESNVSSYKELISDKEDEEGATGGGVYVVVNEVPIVGDRKLAEVIADDEGLEVREGEVVESSLFSTARPLSLPSSFQPAFFTTVLLSSSIAATSYSSPSTATSVVAPPSRRTPMPQRSLLLATPSSSPVHNSTTSASCCYNALDVAASSLAAIALLATTTFFLFNCSLSHCSSLTLQHMLLTVAVGLLPLLCSNHCP